MPNTVVFIWTGCNDLTQYRAVYNKLSGSGEDRWIIEYKYQDAMGRPAWQAVNMPHWLPSFLDSLKKG